MIIKFQIGTISFEADLSKPIDISISMKEGDGNPNCYWAESPKFETIVSGNFIGSVKRGGPVNYQKIFITPHGNGTHTECLGHITPNGETINQSLKEFHFVAKLITIEPEERDGDSIITAEKLLHIIGNDVTEGLIIRTLPNGKEKLAKKYSGTNPPYFQPEALELVRKRGVKHLLVDLPSVDREEDEGRLSAHRNFWDYPSNPRIGATITELIYVPESITDGLYLVNLQIISLETDACPSKPVLYALG